MRHVALRTLFVVALLACMATVVSAQGHRGCPTMTGEWAYTKTGTLLTPSGSVLYAAVGMLDIDRDGNLTGSQDSNTGGSVAKNALRGTGSLQEDCTIAATVGVYDASGATLLRTAAMTMVVDDNGREARGMVTQLTLGNGMVVPQVITVIAHKIFNSTGNGR
jgi:hypothetical protein